MRGGMLRHLSLTRTQLPPRGERAEPRLVPTNAVAPLRRPADAVGASIAASRRGATRPLVVPVDPLSDRRPVSSAAQDPSVLRQIALGCLAVVAIGGLGGAALTLLGPRGNDNLAAASPSAPAPQPPARAAAPAALAPASSPGAATAAIPAAAPARQTTPAEASVSATSSDLPATPPAHLARALETSEATTPSGLPASARQATPAEASVSATPSGLPATPPAHLARALETSEATTPSGLPVSAAKAPSGKAVPPAEEPVAPPHLATAAAARDFTASREPYAAAPHRRAHAHTALRHLRLRAANEKPSAEPPIDLRTRRASGRRDGYQPRRPPGPRGVRPGEPKPKPRRKRLRTRQARSTSC